MSKPLIDTRAAQRLIRSNAKKSRKSPAKRKNEHCSDPKDLEQALTAVREYLDSNSQVWGLIAALEKLLPEQRDSDPVLELDDLKAIFLSGHRYGDVYDAIFGISPPSIALIAIDAFLNSGRFSVVDPNSIPEMRNMDAPYTPAEVTHTTLEIGGEQIGVPLNGEYWCEDTTTGARYIIDYKPTQNGGVSVSVLANLDRADLAVSLSGEIKLAVMQSPYIRGRVIELTEGNDFRVVEIGEQPHPIIDDQLKAELEKNVVNLFKKSDEFKRYGLPVKRSVILAGPPGNGKTMLCKWLANSVKGSVTTIWVTAKTISSATDVAAVFDIARKLSPSLVIMEDLDLISGTRQSYGFMGGSSPLGEMLNQLDGLRGNESVVLVGSTNKVDSLDEALADRPGRFDRIYEVGKPRAEIAKQIAREFLQRRGVSEEVINGLSLRQLSTEEFTGAQIVEIVKGAIFEAVHRGSEVSDMCITSSCKGLVDQRRLRNRT